MWTPNTIEELLDERITFCENYINGNASASDPKMLETLSRFSKFLADCKYCNKLLEAAKANPLDFYSRQRFKEIAHGIIFEIYDGAIEKARFEMIPRPDNYVNRFYRRSEADWQKVKSYLPAESEDNANQLEKALTRIFNEINKIK